MSTDIVLYICPKCFRVCDDEEQCFQHKLMLECSPGKYGDERRRPVQDQFGNYVSRAPRWYLEASGKIARNK